MPGWWCANVLRMKIGHFWSLENCGDAGKRGYVERTIRHVHMNSVNSRTLSCSVVSQRIGFGVLRRTLPIHLPHLTLAVRQCHAHASSDNVDILI